jgi:hypothetical protein
MNTLMVPRPGGNFAASVALAQQRHTDCFDFVRHACCRAGLRAWETMRRRWPKPHPPPLSRPPRRRRSVSRKTCASTAGWSGAHHAAPRQVHGRWLGGAGRSLDGDFELDAPLIERLMRRGGAMAAGPEWRAASGPALRRRPLPPPRGRRPWSATCSRRHRRPRRARLHAWGRRCRLRSTASATFWPIAVPRQRVRCRGLVSGAALMQQGVRDILERRVWCWRRASSCTTRRRVGRCPGCGFDCAGPHDTGAVACSRARWRALGRLAAWWFRGTSFVAREA